MRGAGAFLLCLAIQLAAATLSRSPDVSSLSGVGELGTASTGATCGVGNDAAGAACELNDDETGCKVDTGSCQFVAAEESAPPVVTNGDAVADGTAEKIDELHSGANLESEQAAAEVARLEALKTATDVIDKQLEDANKEKAAAEAKLAEASDHFDEVNKQKAQIVAAVDDGSDTALDAAGTVKPVPGPQESAGAPATCGDGNDAEGAPCAVNDDNSGCKVSTGTCTFAAAVPASSPPARV